MVDPGLTQESHEDCLVGPREWATLALRLLTEVFAYDEDWFVHEVVP
jgi:hypothetical protein